MDSEEQSESTESLEGAVQKDKTKEELEEETFAAVHSYLTASDNEERYPLSYSKDQKRELRRKAKRFVNNSCMDNMSMLYTLLLLAVEITTYTIAY